MNSEGHVGMILLRNPPAKIFPPVLPAFFPSLGRFRVDNYFHTLQSVDVMSDVPHPTLWRTCRVLANTTRLRLLAQLARKQPQSVSELAELCALTMPVTSQSLRALEARGLLKAKRISRRVAYRIPARADAGALAELITTVQNTLLREPCPEDLVRKLATAFTHPSRIQIHRTLAGGSKTFAEIQLAVRLSAPALSRHLGKLLQRGFITYRDDVGKFTLRRHHEPVARALASLALA
jgi:DNA-binding transcriptional ArsR family regulator